MYNNSWLN